VYELHIRQAAVDDLAGHRIGQRDVAPDIQAQPDVGKLRGSRAPGIHRDQARAVANALQDMVEEDRVRLPRVRAPEEDEVGFLSLAV
jgi:hypothetical protein